MLVTAALSVLLTPDARAADVGRDAQLSSRLTRIETAFRRGDAAALRASCASVGKVRVELGSIGDGHGSYGTGQLEVIFDQVFGQSRTQAFAFARDDVTVSPPGTAFARGRWVRGGRSGGQSVDTLTFTLREEGGEWRVHEIRSSR
jgi:hypothetical protein